MHNVTTDEIIIEVNLAIKPAIDRLNRAAIQLHEMGYGKDSTAVANLKSRIENEVSTFIDEALERRA